MSSAEVSIIFVIGSPGSGKGTLCKKLADEFGFSHLSVGDLLRSLTPLNTETKVIDSVRRGELVPVVSLAPFLKDRIEKEKQKGQKTMLVDGFPRRLDQAAAIEAIIGKPILVLLFDCPESSAQARFLTRKLAGREADDDQTFRKRYNEFNQLNPQIVEHYKAEGSLVEIDTSGETEVSYQKLMQALKDTKQWRLLATAR